VKYRKKVLEDGGVVGEISESFKGWKFRNLECDNLQHDTFKAKPDSRYINAIKDDNFEGNPEIRKSQSVFPRHNRDR